MRILSKKKIFILILFLLTLCGFMYKQSLSRNEEYIKQDDPQIFSRIENKKPGVYFFYFPECPWCEEILPVLKQEAEERNITVWVTNIHDKNFSDSDRVSLQKLIMQTENGNDIIVPFIVDVSKKKQIDAQIGLINPNIKSDRKQLIKKEVTSLLNLSTN